MPLLCKWNKQRYERHLVDLLVSAKNLGYGDHPLPSGKPWGELVIQMTSCSGLFLAPLLRCGCCQEDVSKWSDKLELEGDFFFFPFFFY